MRSQYSENFLCADINLDARDTDDAELKDSSNETVTTSEKGVRNASLHRGITAIKVIEQQQTTRNMIMSMGYTSKPVV